MCAGRGQREQRGAARAPSTIPCAHGHCRTCCRRGTRCARAIPSRRHPRGAAACCPRASPSCCSCCAGCPSRPPGMGPRRTRRPRSRRTPPSSATSTTSTFTATLAMGAGTVFLLPAHALRHEQVIFPVEMVQWGNAESLRAVNEHFPSRDGPMNSHRGRSQATSKPRHPRRRRP